MKRKDEHLKWWREARFGLFIHWGLYAIPAGEWKGHEKEKDLWAEWIMQRARIPVAEYEQLADCFNPVKFDAEEWVRTARDAGMEYLVITAKHCDGFAMFKSEVSSYNIVDATPFNRDPMSELADACRKYGLRLGFYYSHSWDWHEPDSTGIVNDWDFEPVEKRNPDRYFESKSLPQVTELVKQYKPDLIWFDVPDLSKEWSRRFLDVIRKHVPDCIVNDRVGNGLGDYETPEQFIPREGIEGDFEVCMCMNDHWGFNKCDHNWKSAQTVIRYLADIAAKGGNLLLNVGPTGEGIFPPESVSILREVAEWMGRNGKSIQGTTRSPLCRLPWGVCTAAGNRLYLHVFDWPANGELVVPGLLSNVKEAFLLSDPGQCLLETIRCGEKDWTIGLPGKTPDAHDSVIVLELDGKPESDTTPVVLSTPGCVNRLYASVASVQGEKAEYNSLNIRRRKYDFIGSWTDCSERVTWDFRTAGEAEYRVDVIYAAAPEWEGNRFVLELAGKRLEGTVKSTGAPDNFDIVELGRIRLAREEDSTLTLKPAEIKEGTELMNMHAVVLTAT